MSIEKKNRSCDDSFEAGLRAACKGLIYVSETDAEVQPFFDLSIGDRSLPSIITALNQEAGAEYEEMSFDEFFARQTKIQDWFRAAEIKKADQFMKLQKLLADNLTDLTVLRIGRIQIDIYVVGIDESGRLAGIKTKAVET